MLKPLIISVLASSFISISLTACDSENNYNTEDDEVPVEKQSGNISKDIDSRGALTQGVIGDEAHENKKMVPESAPVEIYDNEPNIRLEGEVAEQAEPTEE